LIGAHNSISQPLRVTSWSDYSVSWTTRAIICHLLFSVIVARPSSPLFFFSCLSPLFSAFRYPITAFEGWWEWPWTLCKKFSFSITMIPNSIYLACVSYQDRANIQSYGPVFFVTAFPVRLLFYFYLILFFFILWSGVNFGYFSSRSFHSMSRDVFVLVIVCSELYIPVE